MLTLRWRGEILAQVRGILARRWPRSSCAADNDWPLQRLLRNGREAGHDGASIKDDRGIAVTAYVSQLNLEREMPDAIRKAQDIVLDALRDDVRMNIARCTEKQQDFFNRIYPHGIDKMTEHELRNSVDLIGRTIRKNETGDMRGNLPSDARL